MEEHNPPQQITSELIPAVILIIRGNKVILDRDLAVLYGVTTGALNRAVKRNIERFPDDFMFQLTKNEFENLKYQFGISNLKSQFVTSSWGGVRTLPYAFTEQGVAMLSSVLRSSRAVSVNIEIMRTFVKLRKLLATNAVLTQKIESLEKDYDKKFKVVFDVLRALMEEDEKPKNKIGFRTRK